MERSRLATFFKKVRGGRTLMQFEKDLNRLFSWTYISHIENDKRTPSLDKWKKFAGENGLSERELLEMYHEQKVISRSVIKYQKSLRRKLHIKQRFTP